MTDQPDRVRASLDGLLDFLAEHMPDLEAPPNTDTGEDQDSGDEIRRGGTA